MRSIPLLAEEGWLRHQLKVGKPPKVPQPARSASAIARSPNSGQLGENFRPEQFRRTDYPGRAVSERIHFYLWRVHPSSARRGIVCASSIHSHLQLLLVNCQLRGAVIERVEQQLVCAAHLRSELRPDGKKNDAAAPDRHVHNSGLAENFTLPKNPAAH